MLPLKNVHAIGDRANGIVIDAFEAALQGADVTALRPRLEHAQIITNADVQRLADIGGTCHQPLERPPGVFLLTNVAIVQSSRACNPLTRAY